MEFIIILFLTSILVKYPDKVSLIPLKKLELWEEANVRKALSPLKLYELAENIRHNDLMVPLLAKYDKKKDRYLVFSGQRRLEACRNIEKSPVKCYVFDTISEDNARLLSLSENLYREKMSVDDVAKAAYSLFKKHGKNYAKTSRILGVDPETLKSYLDYYAVPETIKKEGEKLGIKRNEVTQVFFKYLSTSKSLGVLRELGKITSRDEKAKLKAAIKESNPTDSINKIKSRAKALLNSQKIELIIPNEYVTGLERAAKTKDQTINDAILDIIRDAVKGY